MKYLNIAVFLALGIVLTVTHSFAAQNNGDNDPAITANQARHEIQARTMTMAQVKTGELEITMEVIDENVDSVDDVTNTLQLPDQIKDRTQGRDRLHDDQESQEDVQNKIQEMHQYRNEMHNEIKEQQAETIQNMKEQSQKHTKGN
jgi:hypothetical protein